MTKISALPSDSAPSTTDYIPMLDAETMTTKRTTLGLLQPFDNPYKFSAYRNAAANTGNNTFAKISFDTELFDSNSNFDTSNGRYTVAVTGFYQFNASFSCTTGSSEILIITLFKNGSEFDRGQRLVHTTAGTAQLIYSNLIQLSAGDYVEIYSYASGGARAMEVGANTPHPVFTGFLVSRT